MHNGTVHFGCRALNQTTSRLVFALVSRIQKSGTGYNNFYRNGLFQFDVPTEISGTVLNGRRPRTLLVCIVRLVNSLHSGYDLSRSG